MISAFEESSVWFHSRCVANGRATAEIKTCFRCEKLLTKTDSVQRVLICGEYKSVHKECGLKRKLLIADDE